MHVLVDECLPRQLCQWLAQARPGWTVTTVQAAGWASMKNGLLLRAANAAFDVLVTAHRNMHHQQNFDGLDISVLVFPANRVALVRAGVPALLQPLPRVLPGQKAVMDFVQARDWSWARLADVPAQTRDTPEIKD